MDTASAVNDAMGNMVYNVTVSACMVAVLAGAQVVEKAHVAAVVAHLAAVCGRRRHRGGAGAPLDANNLGAGAYGGEGAVTQAGSVDFAARLARPAHETRGGGSGPQQQAEAELRALLHEMQRIVREYGLRLSRDGRELLVGAIERMAACFLADVRGLSPSRLQRTLDAKRFRVFRP
jgi:hypothetical protein